MWRLFSKRAPVLMAVLVAGLVQAAVAAGPAASPANGRTDIVARKITMRNQENKAIFEGGVVLKKGDLIVHSDVMVMHFKPQDGQAPDATAKPSRKGGEELPTISNRSVSLIEATGRVEIEKSTGRATCRKAVYTEDERKIILTGEPVAWQHGTRVSGKKIIMFLDDDRTIVEGESHVMIEPESGGVRSASGQ